ncbi:MAG TPA: energy transducer TonB [Gemmatimonadaceae bacterium]|nr:energy transducer TonB [Gemmatimonadaceae bacterium]
MKRSSIVVSFLCTTIAVLAFSAAATSLSAQTNWREVKSIRLSRFKTRIEVSSQRALRIVSELDTSYLVSPEITADSARFWEDNLWNELGKPTRLKYILGNAVMVEPFLQDTAVSYLLTVADTLGAARSVVMDGDAIQEFLDMVYKGVRAATNLSDADLTRMGPIVEKAIALAKPVNFVYPRTARMAGLSGSALVQFVVDTTGRAKPESIKCLQATYKDFADAAQAVVRDMEFTPASLDGHKIEQLVQYPIDFKLNAVFPIKPLPIPVRTGRGR